MAQDDFRVVVRAPGENRSDVDLNLSGGGTGFELRFRASEPMLSSRNEALVASALMPAMATGVGLDIPGPVSARLVSSLPTIVDVLASWDGRLTRVPVSSLQAVPAPRTATGRVGAFFSGGVDSFHTLLQHRDEITDLIFIHGLDREESLRRRAADGVDAAAAEFGVRAIHVETDLGATIRDFVDWGTIGQGAGLATVGHLLASHFERLYIASSYHYAELIPWGSHPLLDPLWSSEALEFVHDGCGTKRIEKIEFISQFDVAMNHLRVCHWGSASQVESGGAINCGRCEKCIRTMLSLEAIGKLSRCRSFDRPLDAALVRTLKVDEHVRSFCQENLDLLQERGARPDLQRALRRRMRRAARG